MNTRPPLFSVLEDAERIWAIAAVHGESERLFALHRTLAEQYAPGDYVVYLGNYLGHGTDPAATVDELLRFRKRLMGRPEWGEADSDRRILYLRGAQEEMWHKLLQIHFAPDPVRVLEWMQDHGIAATVRSYGGDMARGLKLAGKGSVALTRWTQELRDRLAARRGHERLLAQLRHAVYCNDRSLLFTAAGLDPARPLSEQGDRFWWSSRGFRDLAAPFEGFQRIVHGFDPLKGGLQVAPHRLGLDAGCGLGGPLTAVLFDNARKPVEVVEV